MTTLVAVIGANGRSGRALCRALLDQGYAVRAVLRRPELLPGDLRPHLHSITCAELTQPDLLEAALHGVEIVANTAHASFISAILAACPAPIIALGSTRKFTRWPDDHGNGVLAGEAALQHDGRPSLLLHPTMIYGGHNESNVQRLARLLKKLPIVPLPGGGRAKVQPIHQRDVTRCLIAGIEQLTAQNITGPETLTIAGGTTLSYRAFIRLISKYAGLRQRIIIPLPSRALAFCAYYTRYLSFLPTIAPEEIRRLSEDKSFDTTPMQQRLNVTPITLDEGLGQLFQSHAASTRHLDTA